jgi:hypothetical protein
MRIDSSLGNSQYQGRYIQGITRADDVVAEPAAASRSRATGGNSTGTLLSASLANALWSLDSSKKASVVKAQTSTGFANDTSIASQSERVEAQYMEYMKLDEE